MSRRARYARPQRIHHARSIGDVDDDITLLRLLAVGLAAIGLYLSGLRVQRPQLRQVAVFSDNTIRQERETITQVVEFLQAESDELLYQMGILRIGCEENRAVLDESARGHEARMFIRGDAHADDVALFGFKVFDGRLLIRNVLNPHLDRTTELDVHVMEILEKFHRFKERHPTVDRLDDVGMEVLAESREKPHHDGGVVGASPFPRSRGRHR